MNNQNLNTLISINTNQTPDNSQLSNPRLFLNWWLEKMDIEYTRHGFKQIKKTINNIDIDVSDISTTLYLDYYDLFQSSNLPLKNRMKPTDFNLAINEYKHSHLSIIKRNTIESIKFTCENNLVDQLVIAMTGKSGLNDIMVLKHFLWQIKRKMNDLPVYNHMMPILYGIQRCGKTLAVDKLLMPIAGYRLDMSLDNLNSDKTLSALQNNYVMFFDEMQGTKKVETERLKSLITAEYKDGNKLYCDGSARSKINVSFIGATNFPVNTLIKDTTGMRRFWEFTCKKKMDWVIINDIDYIQLWQGIDEKLPTGYVVLDDLLSVQSKIVTKTTIDNFMEDMEPFAYREEIKIADLLTEYNDWCKLNNERPVTGTMFGREIAKLGYDSTVKREGKSTSRYYRKHEIVDYSEVV